MTDIPYFRENTLLIPQQIYEIPNQYELSIEYFGEFIEAMKTFKMKRMKSLKNICIWATIKHNIRVKKNEIPCELLALLMYHRIRHTLLIPTYFYQEISLKNWKVGKQSFYPYFHDDVFGQFETIRYLIFEGNAFLDLSDELDKKLNFYDAGYERRRSIYNNILRKNPYIDHPVLDYFISYEKLFREWK